MNAALLLISILFYFLFIKDLKNYIQFPLVSTTYGGIINKKSYFSPCKVLTLSQCDKTCTILLRQMPDDFTRKKSSAVKELKRKRS